MRRQLCGGKHGAAFFGGRSGALTACVPAQIWLPFYTPCTEFVAAQFPNLVSFSHRCQASGGSSPIAPPPPPISGGADTFVDATFSIAGADMASDKKKNRFISNFRSDLAEALNISPYTILIDGATAQSIHALVEGGDSQAILTRIQTQASDPNSALRQAAAAGNTVVSVSAHVIAPPPPPPAGGGGGGGYRTSPSSPVGQVHISVDNSYTLYVNGQELGSGDNWAQTDTYDFSAQCGGDLVVAFHGVDAGGPAAGIASVEWCGTNLVSNHNWRCTATQPGDGWTSANFQEDETWEIPAHGGRNGVPPWGSRPDLNVPRTNPNARDGVSMQVPQWIWTSDFQGTDEVWCRVDANYDAAHFEDANGLGNGGWGQGHMCADDQFTLYINGDEVAQGTDWQDTQAFTFGGDMSTITHPIPCNQDNVYGPLNYRTAARTLFDRPYLAQFCSVFRRSFAVFSVLTPGFQKVAPEDRGPVP